MKLKTREVKYLTKFSYKILLLELKEGRREAYSIPVRQKKTVCVVIEIWEEKKTTNQSIIIIIIIIINKRGRRKIYHQSLTIK